jgi:Tol biopolymer transport system component/DNA-binding winged helix-turn-helix (wHTH) protein
MAGTAPNIIRFGIFEADPRAGELRRNGGKVKLQEQPFQVLAMLLEKPGEIVTREELRARLWSSDTFVDFDHGLNAAVKRLRDALGDSAENPRFVETLARRGYRFLAPVIVPADANLGEKIAAPPQQPRRPWRFALATFAVVAAASMVGWHAGRRSAASVSFAERRLTGNPENDPVVSAAISPDGKYVAFVDKSEFFLRVVGTGETHAVVTPDNFRTQSVGWFPDGSHVLATRVASPIEKPGLWSVSVFGGPARELVDNAGYGAVSPDGSQIIFSRGDFGREEIWQMQSDGDRARKIMGEPGDNFESFVWSPDGQHMAFMRVMYEHGWEQCDASLGVYDLVSGKTSYILSSARLRSALAWSPDGRLIYALSEPPPNQNDSNLWSIKVDAHGNRMWGQPVRLTGGPDAKTRISLSADGRRMIFLRRTEAPVVYVAQIDAGVDRLSSPQRLSLDERRNLPFSWTPDGKSVIFTSDRDGLFHLFKQGIDQPAPDILVGGDRSVMGARLNADSTEILYALSPAPENQDRRVRLMRIPLSGGTPQQVLAEPGISNFQCARSPSTICIFSESSTNHLGFFSFDPVSGKETTLIQIEDPEWYLRNWTLSPDGSTLALAKKHRLAGQAAIQLLPLSGGKERILTLHPWTGISSLDWAADGRTLWASASSPDGTQVLLHVDLQGNATPVLHESEMDLGWAIPSPDGRRLALWKASLNSNAWLLEGF